MHFVFIPYGKRSEVELLLRDMEAQKHRLIMKKGEEQKVLWIQGQIRQMPLGIYEYVFPKEDMDVVLWTLDAKMDRYGLEGFKKWVLKKMIKCDKIPEFKKDRSYLWIKDNVNIIPIGIRHDGTATDFEGEHK